ncbi:MAG: alpha/beta hydrolase [Proteobacteria bacterium SG_bin5]|nr:MAG: alpha/beta hydrolase [Proteobacteria bacterium SG_bin5]
MRRLIAFDCAGDTLLGSLDEAPGTTGLLIVSGGNEVRAGAHRGMAMLAADVAAAGHPVFRFDRRGVGDSSGANSGYEGARDDLLAAIAAFRAAAPGVDRLVGFGNCDAASALLLHAPDRFARLLLANPWTIEAASDLPPPAAIRARYAARLRDPAQWWRLARGEVNFTRLWKGLRKISASRSQLGWLEAALFAALAAHRSARVLLAEGDATAKAFADAARRAGWSGDVTRLATPSHSFARAEDKAALRAWVLAGMESLS